MAEWVRWLFTVMFVLDLVLASYLVGKPREPFTPGQLSGRVIFNALFLFILWWF